MGWVSGGPAPLLESFELNGNWVCVFLDGNSVTYVYECNWRDLTDRYSYDQFSYSPEWDHCMLMMFYVVIFSIRTYLIISLPAQYQRLQLICSLWFVQVLCTWIMLVLLCILSCRWKIFLRTSQATFLETHVSSSFQSRNMLYILLDDRAYLLGSDSQILMTWTCVTLMLICEKNVANLFSVHLFRYDAFFFFVFFQ